MTALFFELDKYDKSLHSSQPAVPEQPYELAQNIQRLSLMYWAEHCVECAAPACYETCNLYQPRTDTRCRRFTFGAFKNHNFRSMRGYGVEISFKKWAKIGAFGNMRMFTPKELLFYERLIEWGAPCTNVLGKVMARLTNKVRWNAATHVGLEALVRQLHKVAGQDLLPDAFLLEVYNPTSQEIRMQWSINPISDKSESTAGLIPLFLGFTTTIRCPSGYSCHQLDSALFRDLIEGEKTFEIFMIPEADSEARLVFLSADFVQFKKASAKSKQKDIKCVVFDLDNTLWQGILVEGDDVTLPPERTALLQQLDERGILLSIASKNDHDLVWSELQQLGLAEYFLYPQINWNPKSQSVKTIAQRLNIGIDAIAFVDDNPFELEEVARACPEVVCIDAAGIDSLSNHPRLKGSSTADAQRRRQLYKDSMAREIAQESFGADYIGFLGSCEIVLQVSPYTPENHERISELVQRTNQLNFSGHKHTGEELERLLVDLTKEKLVLQCSDRYGSYGTVGFCLVESGMECINVWDLMLSCRVQGKLIEKVLFHHLMTHHNPNSVPRIWVNFRPTPRNQPAKNTLETLQFRPCDPAVDPQPNGMICTSPESLAGAPIRVVWNGSATEKLQTQAAR